MKKLFSLLLLSVLVLSSAEAQKKIPFVHSTKKGAVSSRTTIILPEVKGYNCYKADFHVHTTYSDGSVNPAGRVAEAWYDGLDIVAITDHLESHSGVRRFFKVTAPYNKNKKPTRYQAPGSTAMPKNGIDPGLKIDFNAIHKEAESANRSKGYGLLLVKGCEMARNKEKLGHYNALFVEDLNTIYNFDIKESFKNVKQQGGLIVHNHPGNVERYETEWHTNTRKEGLIHGVEVANGLRYYPQMVNRCVNEKLFMLGNTDAHALTNHSYGTMGYFRTMTFVLAKELTTEAVKDALLKRRTIAYSGGDLIGEEKWLVEFLNAAIDCRLTSTESGKKGKSHTYTLTNNSSITFYMRRGGSVYVLEPFKTTTTSYSPNEKTGKIGKPKFTVENMWHVDYKHPVVELKIDK
jgi:histidinol phosphatase-like PHP family hydrolase